MSKKNGIPHHIAIILDGNRRWARENKLEVLKGHRAGADNVESLLDQLNKRGIHTVTLWAFSTENWKRDSAQVNGLMALFEEFIERYHDRAMRDKIRVVHIGRKDRIPGSLAEKLTKIEVDTEEFTERIINMAIDYGGRDEVLRGFARAEEAGVEAKDLTEENFNQYLDTTDQPYPEPDVIVRTGGAMRMSGLMIWQGAYAEYFFTEKRLPELRPEDMDEIIDTYMNGRERRFGGGK